MKRDLIYRLLGYAVATALLRYAALQTEIWVFWSESGYLKRYYPAWWIALAAAMTLMAIVLFMPAVVSQRYRGTPFAAFRGGVGLFLLWFYWHWCKRDEWIFHDWVAHPYFGECSGALWRQSGMPLCLLLDGRSLAAKNGDRRARPPNSGTQSSEEPRPQRLWQDWP